MSTHEQDSEPPRSSGRWYAPTLVVTAATGFLAVWSLTQPWISGSTNAGFGDERVTITGATLYPLALAGAWLGVAGVVAVIATSGVLRRGVGLLICLAAVAIAVGPVSFFFASEVAQFDKVAEVAAGSIERTNFWLVTLLCALLMFAAGLLVWLWGEDWRSLSGRQAGSVKPTASSWELLDRGQDPTV